MLKTPVFAPHHRTAAAGSSWRAPEEACEGGGGGDGVDVDEVP